MGLFDFIMKGVGFEGEEAPKKSKHKKAAAEPTSLDKYQNFDSGLGSTFSATPLDDMPNITNMPGGKNMVIYAPKNNKDIQLLVDFMRRHEACIINLGLLSPQEASRILDFLAGAAYALRGSLKRLQGDLFLLTPEGVNIMTQK
ncbi:MAG: cell division protein SepF [Christensenellaceae bacterium]|nr:cell division protein SepF [Christensenellaceae bacterium]